MVRLYFTQLSTPIKPLCVVSSDKGLAQILFLKANESAAPQNLSQQYPDTVFIHDPIKNKVAADQLTEYFEGTRRTFSLPLDIGGTLFEKEVWKAIARVPYGQTSSYGDIAAFIGKPGSARAVGRAARKNPVPFIIPCHRIIGANGALTGYAGGVDVKETLLNFEKNHF